MKMSKRQYRIGELAKQLKLKKFVLRFWEKELDIKPHRSLGGQRFYQEEDFETFKLIKTLLYDRKFTLAGAKKELESLKAHKKPIIASQKTDMNISLSHTNSQQPSVNIYHELLEMKQKLKKLQELL
ncbi:MerR family transcriptional regulator [Candidatus Babeliales bacterium]|nr:MerR family transcriptional regulator [Candidatus Babeliales bacterium]MBP9843612.1 MerR family transcriptional regulator [Candidatus Babeliales bacterium]